MYEIFHKKSYSEHGFTIVEILIVFAISAILVLPAIVAYVSYTNGQVFNNAIQDVTTKLRLAQSRALSQVKPLQYGACSSSALTGYQVLLCPTGGGSCPVCSSSKAYEVNVTCGGTPYTIASNDLPSGVTFANVTSHCFLFSPITNVITGSGSFDVKMGTTKKTVTVTSTGVIQVQ